MSRYATFEVDRGAAFALRVLVYSGSAVTEKDISGWAVSLWVMPAWGDTPVLTVAGTVDDEAKTVTFALTAAQTAALTKSQYRFDVWRTTPASETPLCGGDLKVSATRYG